jgi:pyruvate dehydrogenase E1 component alpha subunit
MSDPAKYRTREEVQKIREEKDPIDTLRSLLIEKYKVSEKEFKTIDSEIKVIVTESSDFALNSPEPNIEELWTDVYAD